MYSSLEFLLFYKHIILQLFLWFLKYWNNKKPTKFLKVFCFLSQYFCILYCHKINHELVNLFEIRLDLNISWQSPSIFNINVEREGDQWSFYLALLLWIATKTNNRNKNNTTDIRHIVLIFRVMIYKIWTETGLYSTVQYITDWTVQFYKGWARSQSWCHLTPRLVSCQLGGEVFVEINFSENCCDVVTPCKRGDNREDSSVRQGHNHTTSPLPLPLTTLSLMVCALNNSDNAIKKKISPYFVMSPVLALLLINKFPSL